VAFHIRQPKGKKSQIIPLNASARTLLESHPRSGGPYVFVNREGGPFKDVRKRVNVIKKQAALPDSFRPLHGLRHVYASLLASGGKVDMYTLQKLLTHKSHAMTERYAHLRDEALRHGSDLAATIIEEIAAGNKDRASGSQD
jgi:integrase